MYTAELNAQVSVEVNRELVNAINETWETP